MPTFLQESLKNNFTFELDLVFPGVAINFILVEDSRDSPRIYALLVAHTSTELRFGRDWLYDEKSRGIDKEELSTRIAQKVVDDLDTEIRKRGFVDDCLQDQLIIFQALASGTSVIPGSQQTALSQGDVADDYDHPFGEGSLHTTTARWVVRQMLPGVQFLDHGRACTGIAWKTSASQIVSSN